MGNNRDFTDKMKAWDAIAEKNARIAKLEAALRDIAASEQLPTPLDAWRWCREVAATALSSAQREDSK